MPAKKFFQERKKRFEKEVKRWTGQSALVSTSRILVFLLAVALIVFFANSRNGMASMITLVTSIPLFFALVSIHNRIKFKRSHFQYLIKINQSETKKISNAILDLDTGEEFIDENHFYSSDLDIFGRNSLFQLVNRSSTPAGRKQLADWFRNPSGKKDILDRQSAVNELSEKVDWRQEFQASGMHYQQPGDQRSFNAGNDAFVEWLEGSEDQRNLSLWRKLALFLALFTVALLVAFAVGRVAYFVPLISIGVNALVLARFLDKARKTGEMASKSIDHIRSIELLLRIIGRSSFSSDYLTRLKTRLFDIENGVSATREIVILRKFMNRFNSRMNPFFILVDSILLVDIHWLTEANQWKIRNQSFVREWMSIVGVFEAINSLSGTYFLSDDFTQPKISEDLQLVCEGVGHPLIKADERITNSIDIRRPGTLLIITGSNMSGKSTFLRTLGLNIVLGLAGGPICARNATLPVVQVFSSMRTHDNLEEHVSSFYAELKRIRQLLNLVDKQDSGFPVFYLLDEILKGTNSTDRHTGAKALLKQLVSRNAVGLVSTHDVELGALQSEDERIRNYSFNSLLQDGRLSFPYKIQEGVCESFNASQLMREMGIDI